MTDHCDYIQKMYHHIEKIDQSDLTVNKLIYGKELRMYGSDVYLSSSVIYK